MDQLTSLDWTVFSVILTATFGLGLLAHRRNSNFLDYLLMSRQLTLPLFVATLVASWYGGIFGVTQMSFETGIYRFFTQGVFWYAAYLFFAFFLVKKVRAMNAVTLPELVGKLYGPRSAKMAAAVNFTNALPIAYVISLGIFLQTFTHQSLNLNIVMGTLLVISYAALGGFRAVVYSDVVQFSVMCLAVALVVFVSYTTFGGLEYLQTNLPQGHFDWRGGQSLGAMLVWGWIAFATLVDPTFYQRCFAAKTERIAKRGIVIATVIWMGFDICTTLGGMYARAALPEAESMRAYLDYSLGLLPNGLRGFFLAGVLATILSTLDSFLFIAGNTLVYDLGPKRLKRNKASHILSLVLVGGIAVLVAPVFKGNVWLVWKTFGSYSAACLLVPVLVGFFSKKRVSDGAFVLSSLSAAAAVTVWKWVPRSGFWKEVDELYLGVLVSACLISIARARMGTPRGKNGPVFFSDKNSRK